MNLEFTAQEQAFRAEVRAFLHSAIPAEIRENMRAGRRPTKAEVVCWQRILNKKGWAVPHWPVEWGGAGWSVVQRYIFMDELNALPAPEPLAFNVSMVGPVIAAFGTQEQKRHFLPRIANLDYWFCQGFSEPGSGSDLASLKTPAVREGDFYVINGQKIWTTQAHHADWMFGLFRTESGGRKQDGISFILLDMKTPGITIRPIITIDGLHETNEVFFDNVRVPVANLVGEEGHGWRYAKFLLSNERLVNGRVGVTIKRLARLKGDAAGIISKGRPLMDDDSFQDRLCSLEIELKALEMTNLRMLTAAQKVAEDGRPDPTSSILKIKGSELRQAVLELAMRAAGPHAVPYCHERIVGSSLEDQGADDWVATAAPNYFFYRVLSIFGGSNEIQRNIIAKSFLGL